MLNFDQIIPLAAKAAKDKPIVAAPYPLPYVLCRALVNDGLISGFVADSRPEPGKRDTDIAGWWTDRQSGIWFLRNAPSRTMILLSGNAENDIGGRMLLEARLKGIQRILFIASDGSIAREVSIQESLMTRLTATPTTNAVNQLSYDDAFDEMYTVIGDRMRLPSSAFADDRILIVADSLQPGGAQRQAAYTAFGLAKRFPGQVHIGVARLDSTFDFYRSMIDAAGVSVTLMPEGDESFSSPDMIDIRNRLAARFASLGALNIFYMLFHHAVMIRSIRPSVVHAFQDYSNVLGGIAADWVGVPRLLLGGRSVAPDNFSLFQPYMEPAYRALLKRRPFAFLNNSEAGARDYARWLALPRERFQVLRNGFTFPDVSPDARDTIREEIGIPKDGIVVGTIIRFGEEKRPQLWLEMAAAVHSAHPQVHFVLFGDGNLMNSCKTYVEANDLSAIVKMPGLTKDAWAALSAMDIFVLTSRMEGLPNVLIEAQAMGLPVVCTGDGGMQETFVEGETGFHVATATPEALAERVCHLIDSPAELHRMGMNASRHVRKAFGIDHMIDRTLAAYRGTVPVTSDFVGTPDWQATKNKLEDRLGGILKEGGYCFSAPLCDEIDPIGAVLWEDAHPFEPGQTPQEAITSLGKGRYSVELNRLLFSSSDGTDPRFNGRSYRLRSKDADAEFDDIVITPECILQEIGNCYIANLGLPEGSARFGFWENGTRLGPGACQHDDIRARGIGRYSVWGSNLYFSTSDNSDPRANQRTYILRRARLSLVPASTEQTGALGSLDRVMRFLIRNAVPRQDFVRGRVVHINGSLGPGGAERQLAHTLVGLSQQKFESIQLLCYYLGATRTDAHDFFLPVVQAAGVPVRTVRREVAQDDPGSMPESLRAVKDLLPAGLAPDIADLYWEFIELRPEIVHAWLDLSNVRVGFAAALAGVPHIILSGRNANPSHFALYESYMDPAYKALLELPQVTMLNNSRAGRDDYARWLGIPPDGIHVVHNGREFRNLPSPDVRSAAKEALGFTRDTTIVGSISRFAEEKRPQLFVDTARVILSKHPDVRFVYFGDGGMFQEIREYISSIGLADKIRLPGLTNDVWSALAAMDVFVLTSRMEGLPNVLIEAQGAGVPVVCTAVGGMPETYVEGISGFGIPSTSHEDIAEAVSKLIVDSALRQSMSAEAASFAHESFSLDRMIARTLDIYKQATRRREFSPTS